MLRPAHRAVPPGGPPSLSGLATLGKVADVEGVELGTVYFDRGDRPATA